MRIFIFDLDKTLLKVNCSFRYYSFLRKKNIFSSKDILKAIIYFVKYSYFNLSPIDLHRAVFNQFLKGRSFDEIFSYVDEFLDSNLPNLINTNVYSYVKEALKNGDEVVLLSNSPQCLALACAKRLGINKCAGTTYQVDANNNFISIINVMDGREKAKYVAKLSKGFEEKIIFSDSIWDRPLLEIGDKCFAVNPDRKLRALAKTKGWEIL